MGSPTEDAREVLAAKSDRREPGDDPHAEARGSADAAAPGGPGPAAVAEAEAEEALERERDPHHGPLGAGLESDPELAAEPDPEDDAGESDDAAADYGPPFVARSFGAEFVWAEAASFTCKVLRVRPGENVIVSTKGRRDVVCMLTGGRAMLEIRSGGDTDALELLPAAPVKITPGPDYRLVAITEVELFTVYAPEHDPAR